MKITIVRKQPTKEALRNLYDVCNKIFTNDSCFYTKEEVKELKKNKDNIFM